MFLRHDPDQILIEILDLNALWDPFAIAVLARAHAGEEMQESELYPKKELVFPSGEPLPKAWIDPDYRHLIPPMPQAILKIPVPG